jgi:ATP-dependent DNA helicase RecQ
MKIIINTENTTLNGSICLKFSSFSTELSDITPNAVISIDDSNNITISVEHVSNDKVIVPNNPVAEQAIPKNIDIEDYSTELFHKLSALRRQIAIDEGLPPYIICKDKTIIEMCKVLPTDSNSMLTISGMGSKKIDKYGSKFIEVIKAHIG